MAALMAGRSCLSLRTAALKVVILQAEVNLAASGGHGHGARLMSRHPGDAEDARVHVPLERLTVSYSRSSGPGGQHVNKVSTRAEVRFHVKTADWIPKDIREKILERNQNRINKAGELMVTSELSRSQHRNLSDCVEKISTIIEDASWKPREQTVQDMAVRQARLKKRNLERLKQKKLHAATKHSRRVDFD